MKIGVAPLCSYVVAKYTTDSSVRAAAIDDIRSSGIYPGKLLHQMAKFVPELAELVDHRDDLSNFLFFSGDASIQFVRRGRVPDPPITLKQRIKITHKIFELRRDTPHLLPVFAELLADRFPGEAKLCKNFEVPRRPLQKN